jgi:hypothetical protein
MNTNDFSGRVLEMARIKSPSPKKSAVRGAPFPDLCSFVSIRG